MSVNVRPKPVSDQVRATRLEVVDRLEKQLANAKQWYDFDKPQDYRNARAEGTHGFDRPKLNDQARLVYAPGREGQSIELRMIEPPVPSKGVFLHFHEGCFVIGSNASYDGYLTRVSEASGLTVASVEYRLAPEHPFPAGRDDCVDAALYALSTPGMSDLGAPLRVLGGESAGAWLAVAVALELRDTYEIDVKTQIAAICAGYGIYDLTYTPSLLSHERNIVLSRKTMMKFLEAAFGHILSGERKRPDISPLYADLGNQPPAHFLVGNVEPLLDDSIFMAAKWANAGSEAEPYVVEGARHAFTLIPFGEVTNVGIQAVVEFLRVQLQKF
ncbi:lipase esterase [Fusarium tjaetaba]|uniref:Lipase esterase n=1 Tax=Fusarium tjaetaba TaxID=1567544 RepID=A0A8H5RAK4_9HYPO|nr:lipase esterase [Fusarium tjaetaba]KAF5632275.1 lipase esterase [Fusarium tjaetaba]